MLNDLKRNEAVVVIAFDIGKRRHIAWDEREVFMLLLQAADNRLIFINSSVGFAMRKQQLQSPSFSAAYFQQVAIDIVERLIIGEKQTLMNGIVRCNRSGCDFCGADSA